MKRCEVCLSDRVRRRFWARRGILFRRVWLCSVHSFPSQRAFHRRLGVWV